MNVFELRERLISDYSSYIRSFIRIRDQRVDALVTSCLDQGRLWPDPLIQLNPSFQYAGTIEDLGGRTEHLASDEAGHIFLNMQDVGKLHKLDAQGLKVVETWQLSPPCGQPSSMDMDQAHNRVFIGCRSGLLAVVDGATGKILATQPIGPGVDALEFDSKTGLIYVSTGGGDGALSIFRQQSPDKYSLVQNVKTLPGARTMALDQKTGRVYLPVADVGPRPDPTPASPNPRAPMIPGTFSVLLVGQ